MLVILLLNFTSHSPISCPLHVCFQGNRTKHSLEYQNKNEFTNALLIVRTGTIVRSLDFQETTSCLRTTVAVSPTAMDVLRTRHYSTTTVRITHSTLMWDSSWIIRDVRVVKIRLPKIRASMILKICTFCSVFDCET